jgi:hypothetical protein
VETDAARTRRAWGPRRIAFAWGAAAFLATAALSSGPGISREEASVLAEAGAGPAGAEPTRLRPPLPAALSRATEAVAVRAGLPHLVGYRLAPALCAGLLAALLAFLAAAVAGRPAAVLAPAFVLLAPRLLVPLLEAGPAAAGAALAVATVLAYRRAVLARARAARLAAAAAAGVLFGVALAIQLEALALVAAFALHAAFLTLQRLRPQPGGEAVPADRPSRPHPRSAFSALAAMVVLGPALAFALWPGLWADPVGRLREALFAMTRDAPPMTLGSPLAVTAFALPASFAVAFAGGLLHALARLLARSTEAPERQDQLLLVVAALAPLAAAQAGLATRAPGPGPWLAAFPFLAALAAQSTVAAGRALWPAHAGPLRIALAVVALLPGLTAAVHAWPDLGASWGELAGGTPGAASRGLPRNHGELSPQLLEEISARARTGARVRWAATPPAALAVHAADGRVRPDLAVAASLDDCDIAVVPMSGGSRQDEFQVWAALGTRSPVAGVFLDEVPLAWVYARPGAWR